MPVVTDSGYEPIVDVEGEPGPSPLPSGRILLKPRTAAVVRKVAKHCKLTLDQLIQEMLSEWIPSHTSLRIKTKNSNGS